MRRKRPRKPSGLRRFLNREVDVELKSRKDQSLYDFMKESGQDWKFMVLLIGVCVVLTQLGFFDK